MTAIRIIDDHFDLANIGSNTHAQIDSHISNTSNPHVVTKAQVGLGSVVDGAEVNVQSDWDAIAGDALILNKPSDVTDLSGHAVTELSDITGAGSGIIISGAERTKLTGIEDEATADQTKADIDGLGLSHDSLVDVSVNDHHNELHSIVSHNDTTATGAQLNTLVDNSIADTLHRHSELVASDGSPDPALSVDAMGRVGIGRISTGGMLDVEFVAGSTPIFEMITTDTNITRSGQILKHKTTGNMVDGFGVNFLFRIEDATSGAQTAAILRGTRDGANNEGRLDLCAGTNGGEKFLTIRSSGNVGIGTESPSTKLEVEGTTYPVSRNTRTTGITSASQAAFDVLAKTTGNMVDGFGPGLTLSIQDNTVGPNFIAGIYAHRNGSDVKGDLLFYTRGASWSSKMVLTKDGNLSIGAAATNTSILLYLNSYTGALLLSRLTTTQKNALTAVNGMLVYDTTLNKFQGYESGSWINLI